MKKLPLSLDILILLALVPAQVQLKTNGFLLVIPLLISVLLELWVPIGQYAELKSGLLRWLFLARLMLLLIMIVGATILPAVENINWRLAVPADQNGYTPALEGIQDGALQIELALQHASHGKNPYEQRYDDSAMKYYGFSEIDMPGNPYSTYFIYLPGLLLVSFPSFALFQWFGLPFDERWVTLIAYSFLVLLLPLLVQVPEQKLFILAGIGLNPLLTSPVTYGMNDVIIILMLALMVQALTQKHILRAAFLLGLACAIKQSAWFVLPFYFLFVFRLAEPSERWRRLLVSAFVIGSVMLIITGPLALWNLSAFIAATILYPLGLVGVTVPIRGYTVGVLLKGLGVIPSYTSSFPFWAMQALVGIPLLAALLRYQSNRNSVGIMLVCTGVLFFGLGVVSRFFHVNYAGFATVLIVMGTVIEASRAAHNDSTFDPGPAFTLGRPE